MSKFSEGACVPSSSVVATPLPRSFYDRDTATVARALLGCALVHLDGDLRRVGRIVETEAYVGAHDLACHASKGRTPRTEVLFGEPGRAYVYLIYGMYDCFNVVTDREGHASAVLVRAVAPIDHCMGDTDGPGKLCRAMRITRAHNRLDLTLPPLWIESGEPPRPGSISRGPRIGVDYAGDWAKEPLRFWLADSPWVSRKSGARRKPPAV